MELLFLLVEKRGELVSREEVAGQLWGTNVFVDVDHGINTAVRKIRKVLRDDPDQPRFVETVVGKGYRFAAPVTCNGEMLQTAPADDRAAALPSPHDAGAVNTGNSDKPRISQKVKLLLIALLAAGFGAAGWYVKAHKLTAHKPTEKDTIVLANFDNKTGDPVFDDALKQALAVELGQSPVLNVLSDRKVSETLRMMGHGASDRITGEVGREVCLRTGSTALLGGTISNLGSHYLVQLSAVACVTGDALAKEQVEAASKEEVLKALSRASSTLRMKLGESLPSVQKFYVPIEATTPSLEALKNYSLGVTMMYQKGSAPSIPLLTQAVELDPNFPLAYAALANAYLNLGQQSLGLEYAAKAYQLRDRVSEREKLRISATYFGATGEIGKATEIDELWEANYPRDPVPHVSLGNNYLLIGQYGKGITEYQEALRLEPNDLNIYVNLGIAFLGLNQLDEAKATFDQAIALKLDGGGLRAMMYSVAFLRGDAAQMEQQVTWGAGRPRDEALLLAMQSDTEAYYGRLAKARNFSRRAVESDLRANSKEAAAAWQVAAALREAELGNTALARQGATAALTLSQGMWVKVLAALTLARIGDASRAKALANELERSYPDTMLKLYSLPTIKAAAELSLSSLSQAIAGLEPVLPYELSPAGMIQCLYPAYVRGQAYLRAHKGPAAAAEFQKLLDHTGIVSNCVIGSLAHLQIGRAYATAGDTSKAKAAYQDFFALWKDADPDIPILQQANAEYAKLK